MSLFHKKDTKREVFGQMFTELYPRLVRYATQLLGDGEEARDIVGSVMEQAWKQFEKLGPENRGAWLYTAARNACLNRLKHLQVEATKRKALPATYRNQPARYCGSAIMNIKPIGKQPNNLASVPTP